MKSPRGSGSERGRRRRPRGCEAAEPRGRSVGTSGGSARVWGSSFYFFGAISQEERCDLAEGVRVCLRILLFSGRDQEEW